MARRLAVIMAGDVVGYSRLMAENESGTLGDLRAAMAETVRPAVESHDGRVFKTTGDGFLATFAGVGDALDAALAIQEGFGSRSLKLRLGLNLGDVIEEDGDVFGDGVNIASRLESLAEPGTICVSAAVVRSAGRKPGVRFERLGLKRAKNLPEAIEVFVIRPQAHRVMPRVPMPAIAAGIAVLALVGGGVAFSDRLPGFVQATIGGWRGGAEVAERPTVAVLPFDNLSGDADQEYFTDGLTEDIITDLARNPQLLVIARNSTFAFKGRSSDIRNVGQQLGAGYVVEGSARRTGEQLRVVAQLIDAGSGTHLWSKSYDRQVEDVFAVQDDLTTEIVASLVSYVDRSERKAVADRPTHSLRAYDLVLQGRERYQHNSTDPEALAEARELFARAVELDPGYAVARVNLGLTYIAKVAGSVAPTDTERGLAYTREAIRLEPELAFAYQVLSYGLADAGDFEGSMSAARRSVELNPSDPDSLMSLAKAQLRFGGYPEAVTLAERALRLHPFAPQYYPYFYAQTLYAAARLAEADRVLSDCLVRVTEERNCLRMQAAVLARLERQSEARAVMSRLVAVDPAFSLAGERVAKRFGDSPLMATYLADLTAAGAPEAAGQAMAAGPGAI